MFVVDAEQANLNSKKVFVIVKLYFLDAAKIVFKNKARSACELSLTVDGCKRAVMKNNAHASVIINGKFIERILTLLRSILIPLKNKKMDNKVHRRDRKTNNMHIYMNCKRINISTIRS